MNNLLKYIGSKDIDLTPYGVHNSLVYCEPFSGSFNTGFKLLAQEYRGRMVYNDLDMNVVNFWECIRGNSEELLYECNKYRNIITKENSIEVKNEMLSKMYKSTNRYVRAAAEYLYRNNLTMKGLNWSHKNDTDDVFSFYLHQEEMRKVEIFSVDYKDIIYKLDSPDTFFLIDPPYDIENVSKYYRNSEKFKHDELKDVIKYLRGKWLLTYNKNEYIEELYKDYNIQEIKRKIAGTEYTELYIINTNIKGGKDYDSINI